MTPQEKQAIINYCQKRAGGQALTSSGLLSYYLDHQDEINTKEIIVQQKVERKARLEKQILEAQEQLNNLKINA